MIISQKRIGGLQAVRAPYFPDNALLITRLDNLSIYWQNETRRRHILIIQSVTKSKTTNQSMKPMWLKIIAVLR